MDAYNVQANEEILETGMENWKKGKYNFITGIHLFYDKFYSKLSKVDLLKNMKFYTCIHF